MSDSVLPAMIRHPLDTVTRWWHKLPVLVRMGIEGAIVRVAAAFAAVAILVSMMEDVGQLAWLRTLPGLPAVSINLILFQPTLGVDQMVYTLLLTIALGVVFSPWRGPSIFFGALSLGVFALGASYTRLEVSFLKTFLPFLNFEIFPSEPQDPSIPFLLKGGGLLLVGALFAFAESSRGIRKAYEQKGVDPVQLRMLGTSQLIASAVVAVGSLLLALILALALGKMSEPLRALPIPRVNPVLAFLVMGLSLALVILAFAWKPKPSQNPKTLLENLRLSLRKDEDV